MPGLIQTNALENQNFHPQIVSIGRFFSRFIATDPDLYADVPVSKAVTGGGGLFLSQQWGWRVGLEKWAEDETRRKALFNWALKRAQTAANQDVKL